MKPDPHPFPHEGRPPRFFLGLLFAAALAGNYFPVTFLLDTRLIFGSIFAFIALQLYGLGAAVAVGTFASLYTFVLWNHPYAIVVFTAEVLAVGILYRRKGIDPLIGDILFWIFLGTPLNAILLAHVLHVGGPNAHLVMAKQAVNGTMNVVAARIVVIALSSAKLSWRDPRSERIRLQDLIFIALASFILAPALIVVGVGGRAEEAKAREDAHARLRSVALQTRSVLDGWVDQNVGMVRSLTVHVNPDALPADIQSRLDRLRSPDGNLLRINIGDRRCVTVAYSPLRDDRGRPNVGRDLSESPFLASLRRTLKPMLSDVMLARIGNPGPIVAIGVPYVERGQFAGYAAGSLDLGALSKVLRETLGDGALRVTLLDGNGRVIASSRGDVKVMDAFSWMEHGTIRDAGSGLYRWYPRGDANVPPVAQTRESFYFVDIPMEKARPWRLVAESPLAPYQRALNERYSKNLALVFGIFTLAVFAARVISRGTVASLGMLGEITVGLPGKISRRESVEWPETRVAEAALLVENFRSMASTLSRNFEELRQVNENLENRVVERTRALQESEAGHRFLTENATDIIARHSLEGVFTYVSPATTILLGYGPQELVGLHPCDRTFPEDVASVRRAHEAAVKGGTDTRVIFRLRRKDGTFLWVETNVRPIVDPETGRTRELVSVTRDISLRKRAEEENARLMAQMQHAQKLESLGVLAGGIAHDFNNLLTGILGNADLALREVPPDSAVREQLLRIVSAALRAAEMARQMLAYSGQGKFVVRRVDLSAVVREMASLLNASISKICTLEFRLSETLPAVEADAAQLQQVVMNLITNASEAIGNRNGTITLRTDVVDADRAYLEPFYMAGDIAEGRYVLLDVADTGCGMSDEVRERMFDPFFTTKFTGRGLGLAAVLGIVRGHRGALRVDSAREEGTSFKVIFPASDHPPGEGEAEDAADGDAGSAERTYSGTVLVVDDEETVRVLAGAMFRTMGFDVITAHGGREGLDAFRANAGSVRLVLLDLTMPRMGGEEVFAELRSLRPDVPVILTSGYALQDDKERLARIGASLFIQKPYRTEELAAVVAAALEAPPDPS